MGKKIDLTGQVFGKWQVIAEAEPVFRGKDLRKITRWHCRCECGFEQDIDGTDLRLGRTTQCRKCYGKSKRKNIVDKIKESKPRIINELGNRYGRLTVIEQAPSDNRGAAMWLCQCDCGNKITVRGNSLRNNHVMSCGCLHSKGEAKIAQILENNQIKYKKQYSFNNLCSNKGGLLKFDFAILDENNAVLGLIEYQGEQHYNQERMPQSWNSPIANDQLKRQYCREHNIPLIEIPYTDYNKISFEQICPFLL